ncbi:hypothetical protein JOM56_013458 [Amanita muscaria]
MAAVVLLPMVLAPPLIGLVVALTFATILLAAGLVLELPPISQKQESTMTDVSDNIPHPTQPTRATRNSKLQREAKDFQLGFYSGPWVDILITARNQYRRMIHTHDPFPERNAGTLKEAHDFLLEATWEYVDNIGKVDESVYNAHNSGMTALIFEDGATFRGHMKIMARDIVKFHYKDALDPEILLCHNSDQREDKIAQNVKELISTSLFLQGPRDANGHSKNFGHSAIINLCKRFYYNGKLDCLLILFPTTFEVLPKMCLAMACACIVNCLREWEGGFETKTGFTGDQYKSVHQEMVTLILKLKKNEYHGRKFDQLLKWIATEGQLYPRGAANSHGFKLILD